MIGIFLFFIILKLLYNFPDPLLLYLCLKILKVTKKKKVRLKYWRGWKCGIAHRVTFCFPNGLYPLLKKKKLIVNFKASFKKLLRFITLMLNVSPTSLFLNPLSYYKFSCNVLVLYSRPVCDQCFRRKGSRVEAHPEF